MTATMIQCLIMARDLGQVCGGWNPGAGTRRVAASALLALERRGLLVGHDHASGATYVLTAAGAAHLEALELA